MKRIPHEELNNLEEPDLKHYLHRPPGAPQPRDTKSQKAQLESIHQHGTNKEVKLGIKYKTGRKEHKEWPWS